MDNKQTDESEQRANALECRRNASAASDPADKAVWTQMADHYLYLIAAQSITAGMPKMRRWMGN